MMRALSIRQPWAHAIAFLGKDVENRGRANVHRGLVLIHASAADTREEWEAFDVQARRMGLSYNPAALRRSVEYGGIIGVARMVDCVTSSPSPWFTGPVGFVLTDIRPLGFIPCRGTVCPLLWTVASEVESRIRAGGALSGLV